MTTFGERLKELRGSSKKTQVDMAKIMGISSRQYQGYEGGRSYPTVQRLIFLADYFGVSLDYLVGRDFKEESDV